MVLNEARNCLRMCLRQHNNLMIQFSDNVLGDNKQSFEPFEVLSQVDTKENK